MMKRFLIMLLLALSLGGMVPNTVSAKYVEDPQVTQTREISLDKMGTFFNDYVDPNYFLDESYYSVFDVLDEEEKRAELCAVAQNVVKDSKTQYDKIKAITMYVANHVYYNRSDSPSYTDPFDVYKERIAVCGGYSVLIKALFDELKIPCMTVVGWYNHAWDAAYDSEQKRWIFLDASWCSWNSYTGEWVTQTAREDYFDYTMKLVGQDAFHFPAMIQGIREQKNDSAVYYELVTAKQGRAYDYRQWYLRVTGMRGKNVKMPTDLAGVKITEFYYENSMEKYGYERNAIRTIDFSQTSITKIEHSPWNDCINLISVKFPSTLKEIGAGAFEGCHKLKEIDLSNTQVNSIESDAFFDCYSAKVIKLPSSITKIGVCFCGI